jgi:hypothetical protein
VAVAGPDRRRGWVCKAGCIRRYEACVKGSREKLPARDQAPARFHALHVGQSPVENYLVVNDFGKLGSAYVKTAIAEADRDTITAISSSASTATLSASSPSTPPRADRATCRTSPTRCWTGPSTRTRYCQRTLSVSSHHVRAEGSAVVAAAHGIGRHAGQRTCGGRLSRQDHYVPDHRSW